MPVPIPARSKNPGFTKWESFTVALDEVESVFPASRNVGLILGVPSGGLVDVDLDSPESRSLASRFLPPTAMIHGHSQKPSSHWWYIADPIPDATVRRKDVDGSALVELRSTGGQTIVPPSIHPDGPAIEWEQGGDAAPVDGRMLSVAVDRLAAASLLARHWPAQGSRHDLALAVAGALLRHGWGADEAEAFVEAVARTAGDTETFDRERAIRDTAASLRTGKRVTGIPTMVDILGQRVVDRFCDWLEIGERGAATSLTTLPAVVEERLDWRKVLEEMPVPVGALPYWFARVVSHVRPYTPMFPDDWAFMLSLPFWSALWPSVRIQNLNLAIWTLGVGLQGSGKNVATDELRRIVSGVAAASGGELILFTTGTPEGMWDRLAGIGRQMLCYHDEFGGWLKTLQRDHMAYARETLCSLYDGRSVGYQRAQKGGVEVHDPHVAVAATINKPDIELYASRADLFNGYLSRFLVCAPDIQDVQPDAFPYSDSPARRELIEQLSQHIARYRDVGAVEWQESGRRDPEIIREYQRFLGVGTGRMIDLDASSDEPSIPAGRLIARVKKIAALLELAEEFPEMDTGRSIVLVRPEHLVTAIEIIERSRAYTERMIAWIGESSEVELARRIHRLIVKHKTTGLSDRDICMRTKARVKDVQTALTLLTTDGAIEPRRFGRVQRWFPATPEAA